MFKTYIRIYQKKKGGEWRRDEIEVTAEMKSIYSSIKEAISDSCDSTPSLIILADYINERAKIQCFSRETQLMIKNPVFCKLQNEN